MPTPRKTPEGVEKKDPQVTKERQPRKSAAQREYERSAAAEARSLERLRQAEAAYVAACRETALKELMAKLGSQS